MTFSVLIAAYRADHFIGDALASVAAQTHRDWELVVVEDGSRDATEASVRAFAAAAPRPVRYAKNKGHRPISLEGIPTDEELAQHEM